jgi:tRNA A37 threonylcarbamoyladenosine modification protein TsaB
VSALAALAHSASGDLPAGARIAAWMNAYRGDVFAALYEVGDAPLFHSNRLVEIEEPSVGSPASTWARWSTRFGSPSLVVGDGAELYRETIVPARVIAAPLIAGAIGRLAVDYARRGAAVHPSGLQPLYVRRPDAEVARDRR